MGTLYIVGTPIGNLEDITLRAIRVLKEADLIAAEDTRRARILLKRYEIDTPLTSYFEHSTPDKQAEILDSLENKDIALISEAGMPGISDPGYELIGEAIRRGISVVPIPGASALLSALVVSGLPTDSFLYLGFLPRRSSERRRLMEGVKDEKRTLIVYESPHRLCDSLKDMLDTLGDRPAAVARELTKMHEEVLRGPLSEIISHFDATAPRGEFTLVIHGAIQAADEPAHDAESVQALARQLAAQGLSAREVAAEVAKRTGWSRRQVYNWLHGRDT